MHPQREHLIVKARASPVASIRLDLPHLISFCILGLYCCADPLLYPRQPVHGPGRAVSAVVRWP